MKSERIAWIDEVKGVCMLLILISHSISFSGCEYLYDAYILPFFFVSGLTCKYPNINLAKRYKCLLVPYAFYSFGYVGLLFLKDFNVNNLVKNIVGVFYARAWILKDIHSVPNLRFDVALWFLPTMFVSYVILKYLTEVKLWISSILLLLVSYLLSFSPFLLPWGLDIAPLCAWFILLGCKSKEKVEKIRYSFSLVCGALILYMCLIYVNGNINLSVSDFGQVNLFSFPICVLINLLFTYLIVVVFVHYGGACSLVKRVLLYVGTHSLRLYCMNFLGLIVASIIVSPMKIPVAGIDASIRLVIVLMVLFIADRILEFMSVKNNFSLFKYI